MSEDYIKLLQSQLQEARDELELLRNQKVELAAARAIVERQYNTIIRLNDKWEASEAEVEKLQGENGKLKVEVAEMASIANNAHRLISLRERQLEIAKEFIGEAEYDSGSTINEAFNILVTLANLELEANKSGVKS